LLLNIFMAPSVYALSANQVEVTAVIEPVRQIVVNKNEQIEKIITNTHKSVSPTIWLNRVGNQQMSMDSVIEKQYQGIMNSLHGHAGYGVIYDQASKQSSSTALGRLVHKLPGSIYIAMSQLNKIAKVIN
jgi:hypothetical protein